MKMLEDEEDPFIPSPSEARRFRRLDKMPEHERLTATVRMFLDAIRWVPMRAVDCDQLLVEQLWRRLCKETKPSRKVGSPGRKVGSLGRKVGRSGRKVGSRNLAWHGVDGAVE